MERYTREEKQGDHRMLRRANLTLSVPVAGKRYFGLSRNGSYAAAARGEIPTIRIGRLLRVPIAACERILQSVEKSGPRSPKEYFEKEDAAKRMRIAHDRDPSVCELSRPLMPGLKK
jgi:hypothetical protein